MPKFSSCKGFAAVQNLNGSMILNRSAINSSGLLIVDKGFVMVNFSNGQRMTCAFARNIDLINYLSTIGQEPLRIKEINYWYLSPLRIERTPSFKVNRKLNRWFDFGIGKGGDLIDFAVLYYHCSIADFLAHLNLSFFSPKLTHPSATPITAFQVEGKITILSVKAIEHPALLAYLSYRKIPRAFADPYCCEIDFEVSGKKKFAIGFLNDSGGYELRNKFYKGSSSPKNYTLFKKGHTCIAVFEGFFDFLSYLVLFNKPEPEKRDYLILNGLSLFDRARPVMESYEEIDLFLDNDTAGQNSSQNALTLSSRYHNQNHLYKGYQDINDFLCSDANGQPLNILKPP